MTISTLSKREKNAIAVAKYQAANPEKMRAKAAKYRAAYPEKRMLSSAKYRAACPEKIKAYSYKYSADNVYVSVFANLRLRCKTPTAELRQLIPQELIDVKLLQLTLRRLIKEKGSNNEPTRLR